MSYISSFEIINVVRLTKSEGYMLDLKITFWITTSVGKAAAVNPKSTKTLLANGVSILFINDKSIFSNGPRSLPRNSSN